jgi:hypothetical protein
LTVRHDGDETLIETESGTGLVPLHEAPAWFDDDRLGQALDLLRNARSVGVAHGDLGIHRLYRHGPRLWIEGYGVPWRANANPSDDAKAMATALLHLQNTRMSPAGLARLRAVLESGDPAATAEPKHREPLASEQLAPEPEPPIDIEATFAPGAVVLAPPPGSRVRSGANPSPFGALSDQASSTIEQGWRTLTERWGRLRPARVAAPAAVGVPAAAGPLLTPQLRWLFALLLMGGATAWALLAIPRENAVAPLSTAATSVWIQATLQPAGHPPATLIALKSPNGSSATPGSMLGTVPGSIMLDRSGRWVLQARFTDSFSEPVEFVAPIDQVLVYNF